MGFVRDLAQIGTFGLAGAALSNKKKKVPPLSPQPSMITSSLTGGPTSMIGSTGGVY